MIDIDGFKCINDEYGHLHGDFSLRQTVTLIRQVLHDKKDFIARYGGDEFYIVVHNKNYSTLQLLVGEIERKFMEYNSMVTEKENIYFSIGYDAYYKERWDSLYQYQYHVDN